MSHILGTEVSRKEGRGWPQAEGGAWACTRPYFNRELNPGIHPSGLLPVGSERVSNPGWPWTQDIGKWQG